MKKRVEENEEKEKERASEEVIEPPARRSLDEGGDPRLAFACRMIRDFKQQLESLEHLLASRAEPADMEKLVARRSTPDGELHLPSWQGRVIEGVFDGEHMVGEDGKKYAVPANYASKSKLVEGDLLRLTIADGGRFLFKQRGPIDRQRLVGALVYDDVMERWDVLADGNRYRVLTAAVTYFHGEHGDEAVILVPSNTPSKWAAMENVIRKEE